MIGRSDIKRVVLIGLLFFIGLQLWTAWQKEVTNKPAVPMEKTLAAESASETGVPIFSEAVKTTASQSGSNASVPAADSNTNKVTPASRMIDVKTDVLAVQIDPVGGNIIHSQLLAFPEERGSLTPFTLLNDDLATRYLAQSGLTGKEGPDTASQVASYKASQTQYVLSDDQNNLQVELSWIGNNGLQIKKIYSFHRGQYAIDLTYSIQNKRTKPWQGYIYTQLQQKALETSSSFLGLHTFTGAAISTQAKKYQKLSYDDLREESVNIQSKGGWLAIQQHYFINAWVPPQTQINRYYSKADSNGVYTIGAISDAITVLPGQRVEQKAILYTGPESAERLKTIAPHLDLTIDYGIFWVISSALFWLMNKIHGIVNNWGWSIVLLTLLVKAVFYKLSVVSYRSMGKMRNLQPKVQALKERCGDDKQKFSQSIMELYRKEKINPLSGCLPILIQIPVFIGLYWVLIESVELRQAPWILWIQDLSSKDPYFILPLLMGLTMFLQQKLSPPPPDPMQAKMMMLLPIVFTVLFLYFPAGLVLYWVTNNTVSIAQQWYIMRKLDVETKKGSFREIQKK
ncbi:MAG: yidC [Gammaproteobacteria bacterium]|jgi:YidC/Oxa1 family membrane protein insertase|nr:yidC [Gammaproteobacteria bacterium]